MKHQPGLANALTCGSLVAGFLSLVMMSQGDIGIGLGLIAVAAAFDAVDGPVARARGTTSEFGGNLDSLADMVSFGVAPAFAIYMTSLHGVSIVGEAICAAFVVCAAWRLARFPLVKDAHMFVGCPAPLAALLVVPFAALEVGPTYAFPIVAGLGLLMIGTTRFPTLARVHQVAAGTEAESLGTSTTPVN